MATESIQHLSDDTLKKINDLIRVNIDSSRGFKTAADTVEYPAMATLFRQIAAERASFGRELAGYVEFNDVEPNESGTLSGTIHRWWLAARGALSGGDDYAILSEAERGEDTIKQRYEEILNEIPTSTLRRVVQDQYAGIRRNHDRIRALWDQAK